MTTSPLRVSAGIHVSILALFAFVQVDAVSETTTVSPYTYYHKGKLVVLEASDEYVALERAAPLLEEFVKSNKLVRDEMSGREAFVQTGLDLYRATEPIQIDALIQSFSAQTGGSAQPIFPSGGMLLMPMGEVMVGLGNATSLTGAEGILQPFARAQGIDDIRLYYENDLRFLSQF